MHHVELAAVGTASIGRLCCCCVFELQFGPHTGGHRGPRLPDCCVCLRLSYSVLLRSLEEAASADAPKPPDVQLSVTFLPVI